MLEKAMERVQAASLPLISSCMEQQQLLTSVLPPLATFFFVPLLLLAIFYICIGKVGAFGAAAARHGRKLPPGSLGLPLGLGETLQFALWNSCPIGTPPPFLSARLRRYGTIFTTHLIGCPTVVSMDPELNKLLLSNEEKLVQVDYPSCIKNIVGPFLTLHGSCHRRMRELSLSILSPSVIQAHHLIPVQNFARSILGGWLDKVVDAQEEVKKFVFTYFVSALLSLAPEDPNTKLLMEDYNILMNSYSAIPVNFPGTTYNRALKARKRITTMFKALLESRKKIGIVERPKDFLDVLMKEVDENGKPFNDDNIVEIIVFFVIGGFETTSTLITNVIKFLSENPHVVDELRKEHTSIQQQKKSNEMLSWEDLKQMQTTNFVIKETLRMASIVHFVTRETLQDIFFKDMVIPKGWTIFINFSMVHLSPTYYKEPLKFDPWRWKDVENNNQAFLMPFGGGIRSCLGATLAKFEASIFIHYLVTSYRWERLVESQGQLDMVSSLSLPTMEKGLFIRVIPLSSKLPIKCFT